MALSDKGKTPLTFFLNKYRYKKINITGTHIRWLTWLLSGHSPLAYFQTVANNDKFETQDCEHCPGEAETSQHFLCECIQLMTTRMRIFGKPILTMEDIINRLINTSMTDSTTSKGIPDIVFQIRCDVEAHKVTTDVTKGYFVIQGKDFIRKSV